MIYFITSNRHKYEEIKKAIDFEIEMLTISYPEIQAESLEEVAKYGIEYLIDKVNGDFFIEDSGLFIKALNGFPGVFSSYVFKTIGNEGILKLMEKVEDREAEFQSVIAFYDGDINIFKGICKGKISNPGLSKMKEKIIITSLHERKFTMITSHFIYFSTSLLIHYF